MFFEKYIRIALKLISPSLKKEYIKVIFYNLANVMLDVLTLFTIYPLVSILVEKDSSKIDVLFEKLILLLGLDLDNKTFYIFYFFIAVILVKNVILVIIKFKTINILEKVYQEISENLYLNTLSKNYLYLNSLKHSVMLKNLREIPVEFKNYLDVYLSYYVCILNIVIITFSLIFFNLHVTLSILIYIFIISQTYKTLFFKRARQWGKEGNILSGKIYTNIIDTLNLIHEIKLHDKKKFFILKQVELVKNWSNVLLKNKFVSGITRPVFEVFLLLPLFFIAVISSNTIINISIMPILSVYLYASFRALPSLVNLNVSKIRQKNYLFAVDYLNDELKNRTENIIKKDSNIKNSSKKFKFENKISLTNIFFKYQPFDKLLLDNLNLDINKYDFIGIKGQSGIGKSTLIKIILGLIEPTSGKIVLDDKINSQDIKAEYMNSMSYVSQNLSLLNDTILNNVAFGIDKKEIDENEVWNSLELASASQFVKELQGNLNFVISNNGQNLSGGQAQRIAIARALYHKPEIIILDEATNSLDNKTEINFNNDLLKLKKKITIICISHKESSLSFCDKIYELSLNGLKKL